MRRTGLLLTALGLLALLAAGCAPPTVSEAAYRLMEGGNFVGAAEKVQSMRDQFSEKDAALYDMDEGAALHYAGLYQKSNESLDDADRRIEELYTASISRYGASFLLNDLTIPYRGEDFESVLVNQFMAVNYAVLGKRDDALVEARKVDSKLAMYNAKYAADEKNTYTEDAFVRFLTGVLYESTGYRDDLNDAFISYRRAAELYRGWYGRTYDTPTPPILCENYLSAAAYMGTDELTEARRACPDSGYLPESERLKSAEVYLLHYNGRGPRKIEEWVTIPLPTGTVTRIAFPAFEPLPRRIRGSRLVLESVESKEESLAASEACQNIQAIAVENLRSRKARIVAKAIVRAAAKAAATEAAAHYAKKKSGDYGDLAAFGVRLAGSLFTLATERADTRYWDLLPAEVRLARASLLPGAYLARVEFLDAGDRVVFSRDLGSFELSPGEKKILPVRSVR